jgi:hypothetical protein
MDKDDQKIKAKEIQAGHQIREMAETEGWKLFLDMISAETIRLNDIRQVDTKKSKEQVAVEVLARQMALKILTGIVGWVDAQIDQGQVSDEEMKAEIKQESK